MPNYDFKCDSCGHKIEVFQRMTQWSEMECPKCGKLMHRQIGPGSGIIFRGEGFYCNDYKDKK